jgi:hypothetical protein
MGGSIACFAGHGYAGMWDVEMTGAGKDSFLDRGVESGLATFGNVVMVNYGLMKRLPQMQ